MYIFVQIMLMSIAALATVYSLFMLARNSVVYRIQIHFINYQYDLYDQLPEYEEMMMSPKHYGRWTVASWIRWIDDNRHNTK